MNAPQEAAQHGVRLALEPINRYETDLIHTCRARPGSCWSRWGQTNLGLLLDTFHMNIEEPGDRAEHPAVWRAHLPLPRGRFRTAGTPARGTWTSGRSCSASERHRLYVAGFPVSSCPCPMQIQLPSVQFPLTLQLLPHNL